MKVFKLLFALLLLVVGAHAQQNFRNLTVGDDVPSIQIEKVINDGAPYFNTGDFRSKLLILDFWATTCSACIEELPRMHALQKQFGDKIKILPVTHETEKTVMAFMQRNKLVKDLKIPAVIEDKALSTSFKHVKQPHEVWIYKGKVIAITSSEYVDAKNITIALEGKSLELPVKNDFYQYDYTKPFLKLNIVNKKTSPLSYVTVLGYQEGAQAKLKIEMDSLTGIYRAYFINYPILAAYKILWDKVRRTTYISSPSRPNAGGISPNQIILEVKDKDKYIYNSAKDYRESWRRKNDISYEWISRQIKLDSVSNYRQIIGDLDRLLDLKGRWEKRPTRSFALIRKTSVDKIRSKGGDTKFEYKQSVKQLKNSPLSNLVYYLNSYSENPPIFDETHYKNMVDLDLHFDSWTNINNIRKALQQYDLDLKETVKNLDIFIITEVNKEIGTK